MIAKINFFKYENEIKSRALRWGPNPKDLSSEGLLLAIFNGKQKLYVKVIQGQSI